MSDNMWRIRSRPGESKYYYWCIYENTGDAVKVEQFEVNTRYDFIMHRTMTLDGVDVEEASEKMDVSKDEELTTTTIRFLIRKLFQLKIMGKDIDIV